MIYIFGYIAIALLCFFVGIPYLKVKTKFFHYKDKWGDVFQENHEGIVIQGIFVSIFWIPSVIYYGIKYFLKTMKRFILFFLKFVYSNLNKLFSLSEAYFARVPPPAKIDESKSTYRNIEFNK